MPVIEALIVILTLADGVLHGSLDILLFHGDFSRGGPLPWLFLLNLVAAVVLAALFLLNRGAPAARRRLIDLAIAAFAIVTFFCWFYFTGGRANPMNLGYTARVIEVVLVVLILVHVRELSRMPELGSTARA
ncbi:MAG: hypothetical protein JO023_18190 [Chloroflexi bacterium]|nr:hypothetical protein [Chloroflexota bacterium]